MTGHLVVNADDLGVSRGTTLGIIRAHREGIVTSASLACTTAHYAHAVAAVKDCPDLGIGLHFTLTSGAPHGDPERVPLLTGPDGNFAWRFTPLLAAVIRGDRPLLAQIAIELEAQLARLHDDGIRPDHIDGERHVHLIPGIFALVVDAARRHGIGFVRAGRDAGREHVRPRDAIDLVAGGGAVKSALLSFLSSRDRRQLGDGVRSPDHVASYLYTGRTSVFLPRLLRTARPTGITEVMVHPGLPIENGALSLGNRELERYVRSSDRRAELDACIAARDLPTAWRLTTYRTLTAASLA
jgi:predicted glycoside hydrolase/deacetylase ChbG (UPF0249 family)